MPLSVTAASGIFAQLEAMRQLVAASATFQRKVGAATQLEAMEHAHTFEAVTEFGQTPPNAIITSPDQTRTNNGIGSWHTTGSLRLCLEFTYDMPSTAQEYENQKVEFLNDLSDVMSEIEAKERQDNPLSPGFSYLNVTSYSIAVEPFMSAIAEEDLPDLDEGDVNKSLWSVVFQVEYV